MGSTPKQSDLFGAPPQADTAVTATAQRVFDLWVEVTNRHKNRTLLDARRATRIRWALKRYPYEDVVDAVYGIGGSEWHRHKRHDDLTLVLRDAAHLDRFRDLHRAKRPKAPQRRLVAPNDPNKGVPLDDPWWDTLDGRLLARQWHGDPDWGEWADQLEAHHKQQARRDEAINAKTLARKEGEQ